MANTPHFSFPPSIKLKNFKYFVCWLIDHTCGPVVDETGQIGALGNHLANLRLHHGLIEGHYLRLWLAQNAKYLFTPQKVTFSHTKHF